MLMLAEKQQAPEDHEAAAAKFWIDPEVSADLTPQINEHQAVVPGEVESCGHQLETTAELMAIYNRDRDVDPRSGLARPELAEGLARPELTEGLARPELAEGLARPELAEGLARPELAEGEEGQEA